MKISVLGPTRAHGRLLALALTSVLAGSIALNATALSAAAEAAPAATPAASTTAKFLGSWDYRTPEPQTGLNIATVSGTGFSEDFPQVGWVDFTQDPDGEVTGTTDQGCSWQFALESGELQLAFPGQKCFNKVIGSEYQMDRWTVTVTGNQEHEYIQATSFLPSGTFDFTLASGARMRVSQVAGNYAGHWMFARSNPVTGVNIETVVSAAGQASQQAVSGTMAITRTGPHSIVVRTPDGCQWRLRVTGHTAELAGVQTCDLPGNSSQTYSFWAMAVGGGRAYAVISGTDTIDGSQSEFSLATGLLTKS